MYQTEERSLTKENPRASPSRKKMRGLLHQIVGTPDPTHAEKDPVWCATDAFRTALAQAGRAQLDMDGPASSPYNSTLLQRFGSIAFGRGDLAAGIAHGEGSVLLVSCLKRAYRAPGAQTRKTSLSLAAREKSLPGGARMMFYPGEIESAVGLVTRSLHDARRQLIDIKHAALSEDAPQTLLRAYPFLSTAREKALREQYLERLRLMEIAGEDPETMAVLRYGAERLGAVLQKKDQQRQEFLTQLQQLLQYARATQKTFGERGFVRRTAAALAESTDTPPNADVPPNADMSEMFEPPALTPFDQVTTTKEVD